jgi:hypothetical protein
MEGRVAFIPPSRRTGGPRRSTSSGDGVEQVTKYKQWNKEVLALLEAMMTEKEARCVSNVDQNT